MRQLLLTCAAALVLSSSPLFAQTDYLVGPQDVLAVTVFGEQDLSGKFTVEQDGTFTYPQLGRVHAGGKTLRAVEQDLSRQLADGYLKNPQVSVSIDTYHSQRILVIGEVRNPGEYQLAGDTTLLGALAKAGSTTPSASHDVIVVRPPHRGPADSNATPGEPGVADILHVDLAALQGGNLALNIPLQDGDTVNVTKAQSVFVTGQVKSPGAYAIDRGTTVLQLLSLAGGITDRGADGRIRVQRAVKGKKVELKLQLTDTVEPGDTIIVPERFF